MSEQKVVTEDDLLDYVLQTLYFNLDKNEMHLERDILAQTKIEFNEKQTEHIRELLLTTGMVNNVVGFNKSGFMYLNKSGIALMKKYKSYHAILAVEHSRMPHPQVIPQVANATPQSGTGTDTDRQDDASTSADSGYDDMAH